MDPFTVIRAAAEIGRERPDVKFVFPGTRHPAHSRAFETYYKARELADELALTDRVVHFGDWVAYADWENYLAEANIGISLHHDHIETRFSARSRIMSFVWGSLPMVLTKGDDVGAQMAAIGVASVVNDGDVTGVVKALTHWLNHPAKLEPQFDALRDVSSWSHVVEAVARFCRAPYRAVDKANQIAATSEKILVH
jgi:glycosyltransferase involved in cell wall biosynthesis